MVVHSLAAQAQAQALGQAQAQAQALQAANQQRNTGLWNMQGVAGSPMFNQFYAQQVHAAAAAAQENNMALVAVAKLSSCKKSPKSNSDLVVRTSVRKMNAAGGVFSVAQWTRKTLEENLDWLIKIAKRHAPKEYALLLAYGDGCETLLLIDSHCNKLPDDFNKLKKIGVGCSMIDVKSKAEETEIGNMGVLQASDPIWDHVRFETIEKRDKTEKCLFIHTNVQIWGDSMENRRRVLQIVTEAPKKPFLALHYKPNPVFEQQALNKWKGLNPNAVAAAFNPAAYAAVQPSAVVPVATKQPETVIAFNAKELLLLEKAFDNSLNSRDLKSKADKPTDDDKRKAQMTIRRAKAEFVAVKPAPKKRKKKDEAAELASPAKAAKPAAKSPAKKKTPSKSDETPSKKKKAEKTDEEEGPKKKKAKKETPTKKKETPTKKKETPTKKKETPTKKAPAKKAPAKKEESDSDSDSDDQPISKLKPKAAPAKTAPTRRSSTTKAKSPAAEKKPAARRRSSAKAKPEPKAPRRRSSTRKK